MSLCFPSVEPMSYHVSKLFKLNKTNIFIQLLKNKYNLNFKIFQQFKSSHWGEYFRKSYTKEVLSL